VSTTCTDLPRLRVRTPTNLLLTHIALALYNIGARPQIKKPTSLHWWARFLTLNRSLLGMGHQFSGLGFALGELIRGIGGKAATMVEIAAV
jgi:hypothetical protein